MKKLLAPLLALTLLGASISTSSCAAAIAGLPAIVAGVTDAMLIVSTVDSFAKTYFATHPKPELQLKVEGAIAKVRSSCDIVLRVANAGEKLDQAQEDAAFADLKTAYSELIALVGPIGVHEEGATMRAAPGGGLIVPAPIFLTLKLHA